MRKQKIRKKKSNKNGSTNFKEICTTENLKKYLSSSRILENDKYIYHYTNLEAALSIIKNGYWILFNPCNMNDKLEFSNYDEKDYENIFFTSFMSEQKESIAMWTMYAQPWDVGVKIAIESKAFKKWIQEIEVVYSADAKRKTVSEETTISVNKKNKEKSRLLIHKVAYINSDDKKIICGRANNKHLVDKITNTELIGYIKDDAWEYEKELRLRFDVLTGQKYDAVAIKLTDDLISAIEIVKGPKFNGDLKEKIKEKLGNIQIKTDKSRYFEKLNKIPCDDCLIKKTIENSGKDI